MAPGERTVTMAIMRTADECYAKATDMERLALKCGSPEAVAEYLYMAKIWRHVACQATWQDAPRYADLLWE